MRRRGMVGLLVAPEVFGLDMFEVCCEVLDLVFFKRGASFTSLLRAKLLSTRERRRMMARHNCSEADLIWYDNKTFV